MHVCSCHLLSSTMRIFLFLFALVASAACQTSSDTCDSRGSLPSPLISETTFIFSHAFKNCPDSTFPAGSQLSCGGSEEYIRIGLQIPTAASDKSVETHQNTFQDIGTPTGDGCLFTTETCGNAPCTPTDAFIVSAIITRAYVRYPVFKVGSVPFSFVTNDDYSDSCGSPASCTCEYESGASFPTQPPCSTAIDFTSALDTNCGANRDPDSGISPDLNDACDTVCCASCPAQNTPTASTHNRFAYGPTCDVYQISGSQLVGHVTLLVDGNEQLLNVTLTDLGQGILELNTGPLGSSPGYKIRAYVNKHLDVRPMSVGGSGTISSGIFVVCDYDPTNTTKHFGKANPYVTLNDPYTFGGFSVTDPLFRQPPPDSDATVLGAGTVPTQNSFGRNQSMFFIPQNKQNAFLSNSGGGYSESQEDVLESWRVANSDPGDFRTQAWWQAYTEVPGWDTGGGAFPLVNSPCQMSHAINTYADAYNTAYSMNGGDAEAAAATAGTPPIWLPPNYLITRPNWWPNIGNGFSEILFDISTVYKATFASYEVYVDFSQEYITIDSDSSKPVIAFDPRSGCLFSRSEDDGVFGVSIVNTETAVSDNHYVNITVACTYTFADSTTGAVLFANNMSRELNLNVPSGATVQSEPFEFSTGVNDTASIASVQCQTRVNVAGESESVFSPIYNCGFLAGDIPFTPPQQPAPDDGTSYYEYIAFAVFIVLIVITVIVCIVVTVENSKAKKKAQLTQQ